MIIKNALIYAGGIATGFLLGLLFVVWLTNNASRDKNLPAVEIMRIKNGSKDLIVANPKKVGHVIHTIFIIVGWKLGIIRKNNIFYKDAKISRIVSIVFIAVFIFVFLNSFIWMIDILTDGGQ